MLFGIATALQAVIIGVLAVAIASLWRSRSKERDFLYYQVMKLRRDLDALDETFNEWIEATGTVEKRR